MYRSRNIPRESAPHISLESESLASPPDGFGDGREGFHQMRESIEVQGLRAVLYCLLGGGMDFDHDSIRARGHRSPRNRRDKARSAGAVRGIGDDRQVGKLL